VGSLVAAPQYLLEYYTKVLPQLGLGTGFAGNVAPLGTIARLVEPKSALIGHTLISPGVRFAALVVIAVTAAAIFRARRRGGSDPTLEAAAVLSAIPLIATIDWPAHLALELLPILNSVRPGSPGREDWPDGRGTGQLAHRGPGPGRPLGRLW